MQALLEDSPPQQQTILLTSLQLEKLLNLNLKNDQGGLLSISRLVKSFLSVTGQTFAQIDEMAGDANYWIIIAGIIHWSCLRLYPIVFVRLLPKSFPIFRLLSKLRFVLIELLGTYFFVYFSAEMMALEGATELWGV